MPSHRLLAAALALVLPLAVAGCGNDAASAPGGVSPGEAKALDDAAAMLDKRQLPPEALPTDLPTASPPSGTAPAEMAGDTAPARN